MRIPSEKHTLVHVHVADMLTRETLFATCCLRRFRNRRGFLDLRCCPADTDHMFQPVSPFLHLRLKPAMLSREHYQADVQPNL